MVLEDIKSGRGIKEKKKMMNQKIFSFLIFLTMYKYFKRKL